VAFSNTDRKRRSCRIAILAANYWPEPTGSAPVIAELARFLQQREFLVQVATAMPYYPQWKIWPEYRGKLWSNERADGVRIFRSWHLLLPGSSAVSRILHELTLALTSVPNILRVLFGARAAYIVSPELTYAFVSLTLAWVCRVRRVLIVHDVMPDTAIDTGLLRNRIVISFSRWLARRAYSLADEVHTLGHGMRRRIQLHLRKPEKVRVVPITIDPDELRPIPHERNLFRSRYVRAGVFAVLHTGNMGKKQGLDLIVRTAQRFNGDETIHFFVFGDGAERESFLDGCKAAKLRNVTHAPPQERALLPHMLSGADVVLVSQLPEVVDIVVPSKLITAMGAGAMIVAACHPDSETASLLRESGAGIIVMAGDDAALTQQLMRVRSGVVDVSRFRANARKFAVDHFDRRVVYRGIVESLLVKR